MLVGVGLITKVKTIKEQLEVLFLSLREKPMDEYTQFDNDGLMRSCRSLVALSKSNPIP